MFSEVAPLHVHNQQAYKFVVDQEFVDVAGQRWAFHAIVLQIGATKDEGHFVAYIFFVHKWWMCDDPRVKLDRPIPDPRKVSV